jgi:CRP-like cAMP-binding protein
MSSSHSQFPEIDQSEDFFGLGFDPLSDPVAYPHLNATELAEAVPFGERCATAGNDPLVCAGDSPFNSYVILSGTVRAVDVSTGERVVFVRYRPGYFSGDIDLFTRRPSIISVEAETSVEAVRLTPKQLRDLFTRKPQLASGRWAERNVCSLGTRCATVR